MQQSARGLPERNLGDLLNETFAVYVRGFRYIVVLVAIVQVPISIVAQLVGESVVGLVILGIAIGMGNGLLMGAVAHATGQSYFDNRIDVKRCYERVGWRLLSILLLSLFPAIVLGGVLGLSKVESDFTALLLFPTLGLLFYAVYLSIAVPSIMFEGHKAVGALRRSYLLVKDHWWRVFGLTIVFALVALGLFIIISLPFAIVLLGATEGSEEPGLAPTLIGFLSATVTSVLVTPVMLIAGTLLYYDLRVRKEGFDTERLSQDMGIGQA